MTETKKISELSVLEQVTEQTYLLVEQDGKACRLPVSVLSEYFGNPKEFTFTIYEWFTTEKVLGTYTAVEGMTWEQWVESDYNTEGGYIDEDHGWVYPTSKKSYDMWYATELDKDGVAFGDGMSVMSDHVISPDLYYGYK